MAEQRHIIRRQVLEFRIARSSESFALQQEMARIYNEAIVPLLDEYLSAYSSPETVDKIERLELDLGTLDRNDLRGSFIRSVEMQLAAQLPEIIEVLDRRRASDQQIAFLAGSVRAGDPSATTIARPENGLADTKSFSERSFDPEQPSSGKGLSDPKQPFPGKRPFPETAPTHSQPVNGPASATELLAYYLQTGRFPWWARETGTEVLEKTFVQLLETYPEALGTLLQKLLRQPVATKRLIVSFHDRVLHQLPVVFLPQQAAAIKKLIAAWKSLPAARADASGQRVVAWTAVLTRVFAVKDRAGQVPEPLLHVLRTELQLPAEEKGPLPTEKLLALLQAVVAVFNVQTLEKQLKAARSVVSAARKARKTIDSSAAEQEADRAVYQLLQEITGTFSPEEKIITAMNVTPEKHYNAFSESDKIYIHNAGLVLLLKLVPTYFERAGLLDEQRQWKNDSCRAKACVLLDFLVTGNHATPPLEADLTLNKLICGIPLNEPLETRFKLTKGERTLGESLIKSVIGYWPKIGEQSPDGFRGNFLVRPGIISERDGNWLVQVEKRSYDVLLTTFPWSFSMNKFPWSPSLIAVEWPH